MRDDWIEGAKTIAAIAFVFVVVPVVILKARDRGYLKTALGGLALVAAAGTGIALASRRADAVWDWPQSVWVAVALLLAGLGVKGLREGGPGIEHVPPDFMCDEVKASAAKARDALPWFLDQVAKGEEGVFIKFPLRTAGGNTEHIWGQVHTYQNGTFVVALANDPYDPQETAERRRDVPVDQVEDWQVMYPDGTIKGAYSVLALFEHFEARGKLSHRMRMQRKRFVDAPVSTLA